MISACLFSASLCGKKFSKNSFTISFQVGMESDSYTPYQSWAASHKENGNNLSLKISSCTSLFFTVTALDELEEVFIRVFSGLFYKSIGFSHLDQSELQLKCAGVDVIANRWILNIPMSQQVDPQHSYEQTGSEWAPLLVSHYSHSLVSTMV